MELNPLVLTHKPRDTTNTMLERRVLLTAVKLLNSN